MQRPTLPPVIVTVNLKGGAGKTTLAVNVAAEAAKKHRVLGVDLDKQMSFSTWHQVAVDAGRQPFPVECLTGETLVEELPAMANGFDLVVIDTPPALGVAARAALWLASVALVPITPGVTDLWALGPTLELMKEAHALNPFKALAVLNKGSARAITSAAREAIEEAGLAMADTELADLAGYSSAMGKGQGVVEWRPNGPEAKAIRNLTREALS